VVHLNALPQRKWPGFSASRRRCVSRFAERLNRSTPTITPPSTSVFSSSGRARAEIGFARQALAELLGHADDLELCRARHRGGPCVDAITFTAELGASWHASLPAVDA